MQWTRAVFSLDTTKLGAPAGWQCAVRRRRELVTHLLRGDLAILVKVHVFKQVGRRVLVPHKQVARGQPVLPGHQLHLKQQHSTARDPPGCRSGEQRRGGSGPHFTACPAHTRPTGLSCPLGLLESGAGHVYRTTQKAPLAPPTSQQGPRRAGAEGRRVQASLGSSPPLSPCARCGGITSCRLSPTHMPCRPVSRPSITLWAPRVAS